MTAPLVRTVEASAVGAHATTNQVTLIGRVPFACTVTSATYIPSAAVSAPASGTGRTYEVVNRTTGAGTVSVASKSVTSNVGMSDNVAFDLTLATAANLVCASGDVLELVSTALTSNATDPGGKVIVTFSRT